MFEGKTLIAAGDSHTFGQYLDDSIAETCHERSWVKKLEKLGNFDNSINLSRPGASNTRIFRVLHEYVERNFRTLNDKVIIIAMTELSRFELPSVGRIYFAEDKENYDKESYILNAILTANLNQSDEKVIAPQFLEAYYKYFYNEKYTLKMLNQRIVEFSALLNHFEVEHYFADFLVDNKFFNRGQHMGIKLPYLRIHPQANYNVVWATKKSGFKVGRDIDPASNCNHFDHDGNEFIAKCFLREIKKWREL